MATLTEWQLETKRRADARRRDEVARDADGVRRRCRTLIGFIKEAWGVIEPAMPFTEGWVINAMCQHLEAVSRGEIKRLLINVPPGTSKSTTVGVFWPAWEWGPGGRPDLRYLTSSYSGPNILRDNMKMRDLVASEWYQSLWGESVKPSSKWAEKLFINTRRGQREGRPMSKMTGGRGDRVIIDDPHDTEAADSDTLRPKAVKIFRESITDRLNDPKTSPIVVIMQRLHERDISGEILRLKLPYVHLNLPMEFEATKREDGKVVDATCRTFVNGELFFEDPRIVDGELLFPERFPEAEVAELKYVKGPYAYAGQYQQRPTPREGGMFKRWFFEGDEDHPSRMLNFVPECIAWVRAWDLAGTDKTRKNDPDWTAGLKMGRTADNRFIIAHVNRFQSSPGPTESAVKAQGALDGQVVPIRLPLDPGQAGKYQVRGFINTLAGHTVHVEKPIKSKEVRAGPVATQAEHQNIWVVNGEWTQAFLDEVCNFPNARFDDQVDAMADAFNFLAPITGDSRYASAGSRTTAGPVEESREIEKMREQSRSGYAHSAPGRRQGIL